MQLPTRAIGRTGLTASLIGLGGGGNSRLGLSTGKDEAHAASVVRAALDMGITLIDTARGYQTERAVGQALRGARRDGVVVSSKSPYLNEQGELLSTEAFAANIDASLRELGLETIDIYFIHALRLPYYQAARERFLPVLERARAAGKIRFFGLTEAFESDTRHEMLQRAVQEDDWQVLMVGFNLINPTARERVLAFTQPKGAGTLNMFAVRRALINETWLRALLQRLAAAGQVEPSLAEAPDLMAALGLRGAAESLSEAAYRYCAYEPGIDIVLSGTSSIDHLRENIASVQKGPLPAGVVAHLTNLFGHIDSVSAQVR